MTHWLTLGTSPTRLNVISLSAGCGEFPESWDTRLTDKTLKTGKAFLGSGSCFQSARGPTASGLMSPPFPPPLVAGCLTFPPLVERRGMGDIRDVEVRAQRWDSGDRQFTDFSFLAVFTIHLWTPPVSFPFPPSGLSSPNHIGFLEL